jgi:hypothetical protein
VALKNIGQEIASLGNPGSSWGHMTGSAAVAQGGMTVHTVLAGQEMLRDTWYQLQNWAVYVTTITTKRVAQSILAESRKHAPYDKGDLYRSGEIINLGNPGASDLGLFERPTAIDENAEFTEAWLRADLPASVGMRWAPSSELSGYCKYAVQYTVDHAVYVHEHSELNFQGGASGRPPAPGAPPGLKTSHYLRNAFEKIAPHFPMAMRVGLWEAFGKVAAANASKTAPSVMPSGGLGMGTVRLVRR